MEEAQRMVDKWIDTKKENRKNFGLRCKNCISTIKFAKNDYLKKPYCVSCFKVKGTYEFTQRANIYEMNVAGKYIKIKSLKNI